MKKYVPLFAILLISIDAIAQQSLEYKFFGDKNDLPRSVVVLPNKKEFIVLGQKFSRDEPKTSCAVIKTDLSGKLLKQQLFGKNDERLEFAGNYTNGRILMTGNYGDYPNNKLWLRITDADLNILKDTVFQQIPSRSLYAPKFALTKDGHLLIAVNGNDNNIRIFKMTTDLKKILWTKELVNEFCTSQNLYCIQFTDLLLDNKDNIVITGWGLPFIKNGSSGNYDLFIAKLNADGKLLWRKTAGNGAKQIYVHSLIQANNAYFVSTSERPHNGGKESFLDAGIYRFSDNGKLEWSKQIGGEHVEEGIALAQLNDSTLLLAGCTYSSDGIFAAKKGRTDHFIFKIGTNGKIAGQEFFGSEFEDELYAMQRINKNRFILIGRTNETYGNNTWKVYIKEIN